MGIIKAFSNNVYNQTPSECRITLEVAKHMYIQAYGGFQRINGTVCRGSTVFRINDVNEFSSYENKYRIPESAVLSCSAVKVFLQSLFGHFRD